MDTMIEDQNIDDIKICLAILSCFDGISSEWFSNICHDANLVLKKWEGIKLTEVQYEGYVLKMKHSDLIKMSNGDVHGGKLSITKQGELMYKGLIGFISEL